MGTNYLKPEHRKGSRLISYIGFQRRGKGVCVLYKLYGDKTQHRSNRKDCKHLDELSDDLVQIKLNEWKISINQSNGESGDYFPEFYLAHKMNFFKFLQKEGAGTEVIDSYNSILGKRVFPYVCGKLGVKNPKDLTNSITDKWDQYLATQYQSAVTRNHSRTALRRYLKFLKRSGAITAIPQIINERVVRDTRETPLPCNYLPEYADVVKFLRTLPRSRFRFMFTTAFAFGLRAGEAYCIENADIYDKGDLEFIAKGMGDAKLLTEHGLAYLFVKVDTSRKKKAKDSVLKLISKDEDEGDPKSGQYLSCCTDKEIAELFVEMVNSGENELKLDFNEYNYFKQIPEDDSPALFHKWRFHDGRRYHITMQALALSNLPNNIDIVCRLHAHSNVQTFKKYFQWGLTMKRIAKSGTSERRKIALIN